MSRSVDVQKLSPFGLRPDEPFVRLSDDQGPATIGVREAFASGLLTAEEAYMWYPKWDQVLTPEERQWGDERHWSSDHYIPPIDPNP